MGGVDDPAAREHAHSASRSRESNSTSESSLASASSPSAERVTSSPCLAPRAIPFAAADPLRVIAASMAGSAVTGGLIMAFGSALRAPHGGIWVIALINNWLLFLVAVIVGMVICAVVVVALKGAGARRTADDTQVVSATSTVGASAGA